MMGFPFFYLLESCLLIANAVAILSDRFLKKCIIYLKWHAISLVGLNEPFQLNNNIISPKNQLALILYFFRVYLKCKIIFSLSRAFNGIKCIFYHGRDISGINHIYKYQLNIINFIFIFLITYLIHFYYLYSFI